MITTLIISALLTVFIIGFIQVYNRHSKNEKNIAFAGEYRNKFIEFANKFLKKSDTYSHSGNIDGELYVWLTMNVNKIQNNVGSFGVMTYKPAYQDYMINNYYIIINTIPKFRDGQIENFDIGAVDDCLLRYIGYLTEYSKDTLRNLKNPIVWFREGVREILSIPIFLLNWFGIISIRKVNSIKDSLVYKILSGLIALITLLSGIVTIIVGYEQSLELINRIFSK